MLPLSWRWTRQPQAQFARLDRSHPLSRGLVDMWICNEIAPRNLARPQYPLMPFVNSTTTGPICGAGLGGITVRQMYDTTVGKGPYLQPTGDTANYCAGDLTIRVLWVPQDYRGAGFSTLISKFNGSAREFGVFLGATGNLSYLEVGSLGGAQSGSEGMITGKLWDFVLTRGGTTVKTYVSGLLSGTYAGYNGTTGGGNALRLGQDETGGGTIVSAEFYLVQIWNRALSAAEILLLAGDPYCVLQPEYFWMGVTASAPVDTQDWFGSVAVPRQRTNINVMY